MADLNLDDLGIYNGFMDQTGGLQRSTMPTSSADTSGFFKNMDMGDMSKGLEALASIISAYNGRKQVKLAKQDLNFRRDAWTQQFNAQKNIVNNQLEDRNNRRLREGLTTRSTADFMAQYGVK